MPPHVRFKVEDNPLSVYLIQEWWADGAGDFHLRRIRHLAKSAAKAVKFFQWFDAADVRVSQAMKCLQSGLTVTKASLKQFVDCPEHMALL